MFRTGGIGRDVRQIHFGLLARRQFDFGFLSGFFETLHRQRIAFQIDTAVFLEFVGEIVDQHHVEVFTAEERIAVGRKHFELFFAVDIGDFDDRNIEGTAAEVVYRDDAIAAFFIDTVGERSRSRFVDDAFDVETRDTAGIFRRLTLRIVEIRRNGDYRFFDFFTEIILGGLFHFLEHFGRDLRRGHFLAVDFDPRIAVVGFNDFVRHHVRCLSARHRR